MSSIRTGGKNPVGTTREAQLNTERGPPLTAGSFYSTPSDTHADGTHVPGRSGEGSGHNGGGLKGSVNKEVVQSERVLLESGANVEKQGFYSAAVYLSDD